jgi:hypothetical protein
LQASSATTTPWLIDQLWTAQAVGIIGGNPKEWYQPNNVELLS